MDNQVAFWGISKETKPCLSACLFCLTTAMFVDLLKHKIQFVLQVIVYKTLTVKLSHVSRHSLTVLSYSALLHIHTVTHILTCVLPRGAAQFICSALGRPLGHSTTASGGSVLHSDTP